MPGIAWQFTGNSSNWSNTQTITISDGEVSTSTSPTFQGWQVEDRGGYYSESNGVLRLWSNGGSECPSISLYKQIKPTEDFTFSVQVNAETAESCGVFVRSCLPIGGNMAGFNFEFGHYGEGLFLLARNTSNAMDGQFANLESSYWTTSQVAYGKPTRLVHNATKRFFFSFYNHNLCV